MNRHLALYRVVAVAPLVFLSVWWAWTYNHHFEMGVRKSGSYPLVLRNHGSSLDIGYVPMSVFPGRFFAYVEEGITGGGHYVDTVFECAGFAVANSGHSHAFQLIAVVIPVWPFFLGSLIFAICMWRKSILAPPAFPVESPRPHQSQDQP